MKYSLIYTQRAIKDIERLEEHTKKHIGKTLLQYSENPVNYSEKLTNSNLGGYRFRIGDYRIIFDLEKSDIIVLRIEHRKEIYRKL